MSDSSDEEHPYVKYGTPLQELSELSIKPSALKSSVHVFEQIVTDEEGRRRFHGAFTGGFSAGYYNTVGTKEGWTPSTFKSSRSGKSEKKVFQAEDYMDEEDLGDFGIAPKTISTKDEFTSGRKRNAVQDKQHQLREDGMTLSLGANLIESLVVPVRTNIGIKLLREMGWKEGQGLGPHVVRRKKKKHKPPAPEGIVAPKVYGCSLPGVAAASDSDDENIPANFKFAPKDMMPISVVHKDDSHGIGYSGLDPTTALHKKVKKSSAVKARTKTGSKLSFYGQAFGVGAYEEEDDDIYALDSMCNYDAIMGEEANPDNTYGWTKPLAITGGQHREAITYGETTKVMFIPAKKQTKLYPKVFPPPKLPPNFDPHRRLKLKTEANRINKMNLPKTAHSQALPPTTNSQSHLMADDRRAMLGEEPMLPESPKKTQSVFDFISWEDRQKLEAAKQKPVELGFKGKSNASEEPSVKSEEPVDRSRPLCDPTTLKPFSNNPEKLRRYEEYERAVRQRKRDPYSTIQSNLTEWERKHERDEFSRLSQVYLHLSNNINSRFTKGEDGNDGGEEEAGVGNESATKSKMKVFGIMTRDTVDWHPDPLLCKRFNVPNPYPDSDYVGTSNSGSKYLPIMPSSEQSKKVYDSAHSSGKEIKNETGIVSDSSNPPKFGKSRPFISGRWDKKPAFVGPIMQQNETKESESNGTESITNKSENKKEEEKPKERPPMELFKSIFASSEEESSSDEEESTTTNDVATEVAPDAEVPEASKERLSAADVFMKPLSMFSQAETQPKIEKTAIEQELINSTTNPSRDNMNPSKEDETDHTNDCSDSYFGPALPPPTKSHQYHESSHSTADSQNHKSNKKHKKHKKHDHKSKKKKHKR